MAKTTIRVGLDRTPLPSSLLSRMVAAVCRKHEAPAEPTWPTTSVYAGVEAEVAVNRGSIWTGPLTNASPTQLVAGAQEQREVAKADRDARIARESRIAAAGRKAMQEMDARKAMVERERRIAEDAANLRGCGASPEVARAEAERLEGCDESAEITPEQWGSLRVPDATIDDDIQRVVPYGMEPGKRTDSATVAYAGYRRPGAIASARAGQDWTGLPADLRSTGRAARAGLEDAGDGGHGWRVSGAYDAPAIFDGSMPAAGVWQSDWQAKAIEAAKHIKQMAPEQRVTAHRVESDAECRTRLLAEWEALAARAPMQAGTVPGEPAPRTEAELVMQAASLARGVGMDVPWNLLFSMGLTVCHQDRRPVYAEHDGNRLVKFMVRQAKEMAAEPVPQLSPLPPIQWAD